MNLRVYDEAFGRAAISQAGLSFCFPKSIYGNQLAELSLDIASAGYRLAETSLQFALCELVPAFRSDQVQQADSVEFFLCRAEC